MLRYNLACTCSCLEITFFLGLATWQRKIGLLYNFSLARQNDLRRKRFILSRRSASSESSPFFKAILKVELRELYLPPFLLLAIGFPLFLFIGYWPGVGLLLPIGSTRGPHRRHSKVWSGSTQIYRLWPNRIQVCWKVLSDWWFSRTWLNGAWAGPA